MTQVKFRVAAYTDAAGRYNPDAPRNGNEDNMFVNADLGAPEGSAFFESDKEIELSEYGCLLVVADGMGGMNAGEVASEIAVNVVKEAFAKETVPHSAMESAEGREKYLKKVVVLADEAVKRHANAHPECEGMGSTLVMAWIKGGEASIAWLGDSRIYLFREQEGLRQVSKDHSYVQELVDAGKITEDEAFIHPYNNVITRSLGDTSKKAEADSRTFKLFKGDILLLNSDGLSGVLHDEEMGQIIRANRETMGACRLALWKAAEEAEWHDNVTAVLCEITDGEEYVVKPLSDTVDPEVKKESDLDKTKIRPEAVPPIAHKVGSFRPFKWLSICLTAIASLAVIGLLLYFFLGRRYDIQEGSEMPKVVADTVAVETETETATSLTAPETATSPKQSEESVRQAKQVKMSGSGWNPFNRNEGKANSSNKPEEKDDTLKRVAPTPDQKKGPLVSARPGIEIDNPNAQTDTSKVKPSTPPSTGNGEGESDASENQGVE